MMCIIIFHFSAAGIIGNIGSSTVVAVAQQYDDDDG